MSKYFEDIVTGERESFGRYEVQRDEVIDFARKYDAQPFHLDDAAAAQTHFGRVAASGWHTCAMMMNMLVAHMQSEPDQQAKSLGAIGIDELRWLEPVYPGDVLRCEREIIEKIPSKSRPEMGVIKQKVTVFNQHDRPVATMMPIAMMRTRPKD
jgi:acyl dehydratase